MKFHSLHFVLIVVRSDIPFRMPVSLAAVVGVVQAITALIYIILSDLGLTFQAVLHH